MSAIRHDPRLIAAFREAALAFPAFADLILSERVVAGVAAGARLRESLGAHCGAGTRLGPGHLRAMRSADWGAMTPESKRRVLAMASAFPANWFPRTPGEAGAMRDLHPLYEGLRVTVGDATPAFRECGGGWRSFLVDARIRCDREGVALRDVPGLMADAASDLCRRVLLPNLAHALGSDDPDVASETAALTPLAAKLLYSGRGLPACLRIQAAWHRGPGAKAGLVGGGSLDEEWPGLTEPWEAPGGTWVVPVTDGRSLLEEGSALGHCVGSYGLSCAVGASHVVSVRDPWGRSLSTAEFTIPRAGAPRLRQHAAAGNGRPPARAEAALSAYREAMAAGFLRVSDDSRALAGAHRDASAWPDLEAACGFDWRDPSRLARVTAAHAPLLPAHLREAGPGGWLAAVAAALGREPALAERDGPSPGDVPGP